MTRSPGLLAPVLALLIAVAAALVAGEPAVAQEQPRTGGTLKVVVIGEPPTLDAHATTATITRQIMWHAYETLFTWDAQYSPVPMLVDTWAFSDGGRTATFTLRRGVRFHNGRELTAADAVASLRRWGRVATAGKPVWKNVEGIEAKDTHTFVMRLKEPSGSLVPALAVTGTAIYPKEQVDAAGDNPIKDPIGTGPFRLVEHKPDRHIRLARFKDYAARAEPPDGFGGRRTPYLDEILFMPVPDMSVRVAGMETGEYHFAGNIKQDMYERLAAVPGLVAGPMKPATWIAAVFNHRQGLLTERRLRQAIQAALDVEPAMLAAVGHKAFYRLDPSVVVAEAGLWHSRTGGELYNQKNPAKARRLLAEARYAGQPVRWITTQEYEYMYKSALVAKQQLEAVGLKVDLQVMDWATLTQRRSKPELWDVFSTGYPFNAEPTLMSWVPCQGHGWWCTEDKEKALAATMRETDPTKRRAAWERVQAAFYDEAALVKFGDFFSLAVMRKELRGHQPSVETAFWNAWLSR